MYNTTNNGWGAAAAGGIVGYILGAANGNGGIFGGNRNCCPAAGAAVLADENGKLDAILANQASFQRADDTQRTIDATTAGTASVLGSLNQINRDNYALNIQQIINAQNQNQLITRGICKTQEAVVADGEKTRAQVASFERMYMNDRYSDLERQLAAAQQKIALQPVELALAGLSCQVSRIDNCIAPAAVRCVSSCGCGSNCNPYTLPPLVGEASVTHKYSPTTTTTSTAA